MHFWRVKPIDELFQESKQEKLPKAMGAIDLVALGVGAVIGTGIFVLTGVAAAEYAGPGVTLSFILSGLGAGLAALVYAELASMVPVAGSAYTFAYASLGEMVAWVIGWNLILEYLVAAGAVAIGWSSYLSDLLRSAGIGLPHALTAGPLAGGIINLPALLIVALLTSLTITGTRHSAEVSRIIVAIKIAVIILFLVLGFSHVNPANWRPFTPFGLLGVAHGAAIIFFAYVGFDAVATAAEEVRDPRRDLPLGIIGTLLIATVLYVAVALALTGMVHYSTLNNPSPVATALLSLGIRWASGIVSLGALAGLTSVLLVDIYAQSRIFFAMARDGLLPAAFHRLHPRYQTPYVALWVVGGGIALIGSFLPIDIVAQLANIGTLTAFIIVSIGVLVLRKSRPDLKRPFRVPGYPYTPVAAAAFSVYLASNLPPLTWVRFVVWMAIGLIVYFGYGATHSQLAREPFPLAGLPKLARKPWPKKRKP